MNPIMRALYEAKGVNAENVINEQVLLFETLDLSSEKFPEECMEIILEILSVEDLYKKSGLDAFILSAVIDPGRLSINQKSRLFEATSRNYKNYDNEKLCWILCDFIARSLDFDSALNFFENSFDSSLKEGKRGIALGLDILARSSRENPSLMRRIEKVLITGKTKT